MISKESERTEIKSRENFRKLYAALHIPSTDQISAPRRSETYHLVKKFDQATPRSSRATMQRFRINGPSIPRTREVAKDEQLVGTPHPLTAIASFGVTAPLCDHDKVPLQAVINQELH
jgi:hypothetical protein